MTPIRAMLAVVAAASGLVALYGLFIDSSGAKLPLTVSGLAVFGLSIGLLGFVLAGEAARQGEQGRLGRALLVSFVGGLCVLAAAGALAGAIVLGILTGAA
jgi:hypothetical protein